MKSLNILMLYPEIMNIYGDMGNLDFLSFYAEQSGINVNKVFYNLGDDFSVFMKDQNSKPDIILGGGGQDSSQCAVEEDLQNIKVHLQELATDNVPMLMICGLYQLFGTRFVTSEKKIIKGIGLLDVETIAGDTRIIGNQIITNPNPNISTKPIYGFENHSGKTHILDPATKPLGNIKFAEGGNNGSDSEEGAMKNNVIGSYLHGPIIPKNPDIAEFLIQTAIQNKYNEKTEFNINADLLDTIKSAREIAETLNR
ncbi:MAG: glutamine amidotransferase [Bifidobacteriaceae bacterium]|jgi:CobQ-like glutamine amidotransferase family enzyme|nr:glutamine amidotransferase [Bifidobacteriaceae bacterium]